MLRAELVERLLHALKEARKNTRYSPIAGVYKIPEPYYDEVDARLEDIIRHDEDVEYLKEAADRLAEQLDEHRVKMGTDNSTK